MKVEVIPHAKSRRGDPVEVGNVYTNPHGRPHYKISQSPPLSAKDKL